jgi:hypothetical protein
MAGRRELPRPTTSDQLIAAVARRGRIIDLPESRRRWFTNLDLDTVLTAGQPAPDRVEIPRADANRILRGIVRFVVDVPADANLDVVWTLGDHELLVRAGSIDLTCATGQLTVSVLVTCDELGRDRRVAVQFAVGTPTSPRGMYMSALTRLDAPAIIAEAWSDALTAFCWEAVLELARRVSADVGDDADGRSLIPGAIASGDNVFVVHPMARHDLSGLSS